jgi:hypothetical protein
MTLRELEQIVSLGEGVSLEFKRKVPKARRIAKEVIALANTHGGRILLGVDDDGTLAGVDDAAEEEFVLRRAIETHCTPAIDYDTERVVIAPRRDVIVVRVPESARKPHHLVGDASAESVDVGGDGTPYVRVEEMSVEASPESVRMMREDGDDGMSLQFGEVESLLMRYLDDYGRITVDQFARLADIPTDRASETLVSLAKADLLQFHTDRDEDYFTLRYS